MRLAGRVAIVSGGSRGIGTGIAKCMAREGASVVVNYFKSEGPAHDVVRDIEAAGGTAVAIKADVGDYGEVEAMVDETVSKFGQARHHGRERRDQGAREGAHRAYSRRIRLYDPEPPDGGLQLLPGGPSPP